MTDIFTGKQPRGLNLWKNSSESLEDERREVISEIYGPTYFRDLKSDSETFIEEK